jgi:ribosome-associated protein
MAPTRPESEAPPQGAPDGEPPGDSLEEIVLDSPEAGDTRPLIPDQPATPPGQPEPLAVAKDIVQFASDKGAADILLIDIRKLSIIADYFIICSGDNERQIRAINQGIRDGVEERWGLSPLHRVSPEQEQAGWVLLDYGGVVVHVFSPQMREFYRLERLWSEAATLLRMQ